MKQASALAFGLLFGIGLLVSGMGSPLRVLGFLDVAGAWDPSLAFVMGGAVLTAAPLFARARKGQPAEPTGPIDRRLIIGAAVFGIGWGLAGVCPGPAITDLALAPVAALVFIAPMALGLWLARWPGRTGGQALMAKGSPAAQLIDRRPPACNDRAVLRVGADGGMRQGAQATPGQRGHLSREAPPRAATAPVPCPATGAIGKPDLRVPWPPFKRVRKPGTGTQAPSSDELSRLTTSTRRGSTPYSRNRSAAR